ncbi:MAG: UDP-N-acetylglucosamine 1-carboxyvinyltransferase 1 [candidate division WS2 bacterium]|nr:UDP-N-acetylglucosamine 1-carboxyvinyltransferase 1 [Candidatus Lithacetigena glycinireducens]
MIRVQGGAKLSGVVKPAGAKNTTLPILAGVLLKEGEWVLNNFPLVQDTLVMIKLLEELGCKVKVKPAKHQAVIKVPTKLNTSVESNIFSSIRGSIFLLGTLLARESEALIPYPGGCNIGQRPIDLHIKGLEALGVKFDLASGLIHAKVEGKVAGRVYLDYPSVGATENLMLFASLISGEVTIDNAAQEPQVVDLGNFLKASGVNIYGIGTHSIKIKGTRRFNPIMFSIPSDPLEAGTFLIASAMTGGDVTVKDVNPKFLNPLLHKLSEVGAEVRMQNTTSIRVLGKSRPRAANIKTLPFPGFPTDLQPQMTSLLAIAEGVSLVVEIVFENRFQHFRELNKMGAHITVEGRQAIIRGVDKLQGAEVIASDIRGGSSLILAGLVAEGETRILDDFHIHRGYENLMGKLGNLGANITSQIANREVQADE